MRYITDKQARDTPSLAGLDAAAQGRVITDAAALYSLVTERPWIEDTDVRAWADLRGWDATHTNTVLAFLRDRNQVLGFTDPLPPPPPVPGPTPAPVAADYDPDDPDYLRNETVDTLSDMASDLEIDGRSKMDKAELIRAIYAARLQAERDDRR